MGDKRRWRYEKSIQGVKRALLKKTKVIFILVAVHAARSATNDVFFLARESRLEFE